MHHFGWHYFILVWLAATSSGWAQAEKMLAGDKFQNVTALHEMPADQMGKVMNIMSAALGVGCAHCHVGYEFAKEDNVKKQIARKMIAMTLALNKENFAGRTIVTCMTCHQGQAVPVSALQSATALTQPVPPALPTIKPANATQPSASGDSVEQILSRHAAAMRVSSSPVATVESLSAERLEPGGKKEAMTIHWRGSNHWEQTTQYERLKVTERYAEGVVEKLAGDSRIDLKPDEAAQIKIEAHLALGLKLSALYANWTDERPSGDNPQLQVLRAVDGELTHTFLFDSKTGLLQRRTTASPTILGAHVVEVVYDDYRIIAGRRLPIKTIFNMPAVTWQRQIQSPAPKPQ